MFIITLITIVIIIMVVVVYKMIKCEIIEGK